MDPSPGQKPPVLVPDRPLPPYSYVPGRFPHPIRDPQGHSFAAAPEPPDLDARTPADCEMFRRGIDLFNYGYYWEAHEAWEAVWMALGRKGSQADFVKGLIKLSAALVKAREGNPAGVRRHAGRAGQLFEQADPAAISARFRLPLAALRLLAARLAAEPDAFVDDADVPVRRVGPWQLELETRSRPGPT